MTVHVQPCPAFRVRYVCYAAYFLTGKKGCLPDSESSGFLPEMGGKDTGYDKDHDKSGGLLSGL